MSSVPSLSAGGKTLNDLIPPNEANAGFKAALEFIIHEEPQRSDENCIERLQEDLNVNLLYFDRNISGPTPSVRGFRDYLSGKGFHCPQHPSSIKLVWVIPYRFLQDDEDKAFDLSFHQASRLQSGRRDNQCNLSKILKI